MPRNIFNDQIVVFLEVEFMDNNTIANDKDWLQFHDYNYSLDIGCRFYGQECGSGREGDSDCIYLLDHYTW